MRKEKWEMREMEASGRWLCDECCGTGVIFLAAGDDCRRSVAADGCSREEPSPACGGLGYTGDSGKDER